MNDNNIIKKCAFGEVTIRLLFFIIISLSILSIIPQIIFNSAIITSLFIPISILIMLLYYFKVNKNNLLLLFTDFKANVNIKEISTLVLFTLLFSLNSSILVTSLIALFDRNTAAELMINSNTLSKVASNVFLLFFFACIIAPISEELMYRAVIFKRLSIHKNVLLAVIVSSLIFASQHSHRAMLGAFMLAIVNCLIYLKYKNILYPMFIHCLYNLSFLIISFFPFINNVIDIDFNSISSNTLTIQIIISLTIVIISLIAFIKIYIKNKDILKTCTFKEQEL